MGDKVLSIVSIDINGMINPIGIDIMQPVFHYVSNCGDNGKSITAYNIIVKRLEGEIVWDSGKTISWGKPYIEYDGEDLQSKTQYSVKIKLWDNQDFSSEFSEEYIFETGRLGEDWSASWVEPVQEKAEDTEQLMFFELFRPREDFFTGDTHLKTCQNIRRKFECEKTVKKVRIYASAHGVYQLMINGKEISGRRLAPEVSAYQDILYYQTYDATEFVIKGKNVITATLADGWWIGRLGISGDSCQYGNKLGFIMEMEIFYSDGSFERIISDEKFKSHASNIKYSDLYIGEKQDLSEEIEGWDLPNFDDSSWNGCSLLDTNKSNLVGQGIDSVQVIEELNPAKIFRDLKNELIIDFGQVIAGIGRFEIEGKKGVTVTFEHSEVIDKEGNFKNNIIGRNKNQKDVLICKEGIQNFEPKFTYHGFRYIRITGLEEKQIKKVTALVLGTKLKKTGFFECSDQKLNQLQHNIEWSTIGNMFSIPTDCPQREKLGWTGDIQVFAKAGCFNYDLKNFLASWMMNLRAEQKENGEIPVVIPNFPYQEKLQMAMSGSNSSSAWSDACVLVPFYHYQCFGDKRILSDNFNTMKKWMNYVENVSKQEPEGYEEFDEAKKQRNQYLWNKGYHFGDWLIPSLRALPDGIMLGTRVTGAVVGSCFYAITVRYFIEVCKVLKEDEKVKYFEELLENIKSAIVQEYVADDGTVNSSDLQGLYVIVLESGAVEGEIKKKVLEKLVQLIKANDYCLDTGFASVSFLLDILSENGYKDIAYKLLFQTKAPSWLYMVENGATTMWENWVAVTPEGEITDSSYNHYAFGCVGDWIYRNIGGIRIGEPGYKKIIFKPDFECGLEYSKCHIDSPYGRVACNWEKTIDGYKVDIKLPVDTTAELHVGDKIQMCSSGKYSFSF